MDLANRLTPKQEHFARLVVGGCDYSSAYRQAYDASSMRPATVHCEASRLRRNPEVAARLNELSTRADEVTAASAADTRRWVIERLREEAVGADTATARLKGLELLGKAAGLFQERKDDKPDRRSSVELLMDIERVLNRSISFTAREENGASRS